MKVLENNLEMIKETYSNKFSQKIDSKIVSPKFQLNKNGENEK